MRAVFRLVAVAALIANIEGDIVEYGDELVKHLLLTNALAGDIKAEVINPNAEVEFIEKQRPEEDVVFLVRASSPVLSDTGICGGTLGIKLTATEDVFCRIEFVGLEMDSFENNKETLQLGLLFQYEAGSETKKPLSLEVPIFVQPSEYAEADKQKEFETWATTNNVGIVAPFDSQTLSDLRDTKKTKLTFKWLSDLLSFGVTKSKEPLFLENLENPVDSFVSRPIVISEGLANEFKSLVAR